MARLGLAHSFPAMMVMASAPVFDVFFEAGDRLIPIPTCHCIIGPGAGTRNHPKVLVREPPNKSPRIAAPQPREDAVAWIEAALAAPGKTAVLCLYLGWPQKASRLGDGSRGGGENSAR